MELEKIKEMLRKYLDEEGAEALSKRLGVSRQNIWAVLVGKWSAGGKLLRALGLESKQTIVALPPRSQPRMKAKERSAFVRASQRAHQITNRAVKAGQLPNLKAVELPCTDCKVNRATVYDHRDYSKPLKVSPVCQRCNLRRGPGIMGRTRVPKSR